MPVPSETKNTEPNKADPVLCYISGLRAFFRTQAIEDQWADDWNDAPYEHNAGRPYGPHFPGEKWAIVEIHFDGDYSTPSDSYRNSPWSVEQINAGEVPWLVYPAWNDGKPTTCIMAGTPLSEFKRLIWQTGGEIYEKTPNPVQDN